MRRPAAAFAFATVALAAPLAGAQVLPTAVSCLILPFETIELAAPTAGIVAEIRVRRGDAIIKGDLLIRLDDSVQAAYLATVVERASDRSQLEQAEVRREIADASVERNRSLFEQRLLQGDVWDQIQGASRLAAIEAAAARHALRLAELEVARAEAALAQTRILAPTDAVVIDVAVSVGEAAGNGPLASLAVIDPLRVELFVGAESYASWTSGQAVAVRGRHEPERLLEATVSAVDPIADAGTGIVRVQLEIDNGDGAILAGQQCELAASAG